MSQGTVYTPISRLRPVPGDVAVVLPWELAILALSGAVSAAAVGMIDLQLRLPGHSILQAVLPMAIGWSLVPRRYAGAGMSLSAAVTAGALMKAGQGEFGAGAWTSLVSLGPALDLLIGSSLGRRWPALAVAVAGLAANTMAFVAKAIEKRSQIPLPGSGMGGGGGRGMGMGGGRGMGGGMGRGRDWDSWIQLAPYSYLICGIVAGLICGVVFFRLRRDRLDHLTETPAP